MKYKDLHNQPRRVRCYEGVDDELEQIVQVVNISIGKCYYRPSRVQLVLESNEASLVFTPLAKQHYKLKKSRRPVKFIGV